MDRFKFGGVLHPCIRCWFVLPYVWVGRIRPGHVRLDCARMTNEQFSLLMIWAMQLDLSKLDTKKQALLDEIAEEHLRRVACANLHQAMAIPDGVSMAELLNPGHLVISNDTVVMATA